MLTHALTTVLAGAPPGAPVPLDAGAWTRITQVAGYVKWVCIMAIIASVMGVGALLMVDNRLVDEYGPSFQAIAIKILIGAVLVGAAAQVAQLFTS